MCVRARACVCLCVYSNTRETSPSFLTIFVRCHLVSPVVACQWGKICWNQRRSTISSSLFHSFLSKCLFEYRLIIYCSIFQMILYICSFLEASTLVHGLSLVCKQFYPILKDNSLWKARINRISPYNSYPLLQPGKFKLIASYALHDHSFCK